MGEPIGPGDWVECADNSPRPGNTAVQIYELQYLRVGALYHVAGLGRSNSIFISGLPASGEHYGYGWYADRFRPIYRPRADLIERLLEPVSDLVPTTPETVGG